MRDGVPLAELETGFVLIEVDAETVVDVVLPPIQCYLVTGWNFTETPEQSLSSGLFACSTICHNTSVNCREIWGSAKAYRVGDPST